MSSNSKISRVAISQVQAHLVDWEKILSPKLYSTIHGYSQLKMVPIDMIFLPLLSLSASLMGLSTVKIDDLGFEEPAILWTVAVQSKGEYLFRVIIIVL